MFTRQQYLNRECTHREYYAQFVDKQLKRDMTKFVSYELILSSEKENFNDIPLRRWDAAWSVVSTLRNKEKMKTVGDFLTPAGIVCILKEAARQIKEENLARKRVVYYSNH